MMRATIRRRIPGVALAIVALAVPANLAAQQRGQAGPQQRPAPLVRANGVVDWNRYYTTTETHTILRELARRFPALTELYSIGKSFKGVDLMVIEVTSEATGKAIDKPALYIDGGIQAGDLTSSAVTLHLLGHLLQNYGKDAQVTALLDTRAFYIRPKTNPDGADLALAQSQRLAGGVRPWDDDGDGAMDEDPPDDLDRDGRITQMRIRTPRGDWKLHPEDDRLLVRRTPADTTGPFFLLSEEGLDNDRDGRFNEDGIGGIDLNRNFPRNWIREHVQEGAGPFPLSEPETAATVRFITDRPNIAGIVQGHAGGGFLQRLPADDPARFDSTDLALVEELGRGYTTSTGGRPVRAAFSGMTSHALGTLLDWGYNDRGIIGWMPVYAPPDFWVTDADGDGRISELEALRFNDEKLEGRYFKPWTLRGHPQLGEMEVGGWLPLFRRNPPPEFLEQECAAQVPWILSLLERSPRIEVVPRVAGTADNRVRIDVTVTNTGWLPTHLTARGAVGRPQDDGSLTHQVVAPPVASVVVAGAQLLGPARLVIGHLAGSNPHARTVTERSRTVTFYAHKTAAVMRVTVSVHGGPAGNVTTGEIVYR